MCQHVYSFTYVNESCGQTFYIFKLLAWYSSNCYLSPFAIVTSKHSTYQACRLSNLPSIGKLIYGSQMPRHGCGRYLDNRRGTGEGVDYCIRICAVCYLSACC
jgi:hypothetical protein